MSNTEDYFHCFGKGPSKCKGQDNFDQCLSNHEQECKQKYLNE